MNDDTGGLEARLKTFKPLPLPETVAAGVRAALEAPGAGRPHARRATVIRWGGAALAAAAAAMLVLSVSLNRDGGPRTEPAPELVQVVTVPPVAMPDDAYRFVSAETYVVDRHSEGAATNSRGEPILKVRYRCVDRVQWHNAGRGATFVTTCPREEVRMVSLETH